VSGYTDNVGNPETNVRLSQQRADLVKSELVQMGIAADRLTAQGFGEEDPIADNSTAEGRDANRRVSLTATDH
jgi:outer membrane protein OmpA-like peptidoglycan-associated protein